MNDTASVSASLAFAPVHTLAPRIASGDLSPVTVVEACLSRIARADGKLHAFTAVYAEEALQAAEAARQAIAAGHRVGPLHGIPIALKDLLEMEGRVTTAGSQTWAGRRSPLTATAVERLRAAGMIVLGKTHLVEFAFGGWGTNATQGTPWNPWDLDVHRVPGGSSSGSAVAVAAGLAPCAIGSDTGGSVRIPAAFCGLVGLKVTWGRISNHGVVPLCSVLDTLGPMTRSVEDAALLFRALNGPDPCDPGTAGVPFVDPMPGLKRGAAGLRVGRVSDAVLAEAEVSAEVVAHYEAALEALTGLGVRLDTVDPGASFLALQRQSGVLMASEGYQLYGEAAGDPEAPFDPAVRKRLLSGREIPAADYIAVCKHRAQARAEADALLADYDALALPTTLFAAPPVAEADEDAVPHSRLTRAVNYLGLCALALPMGFTGAGLPTSLQLVSRGFAESRLLRLGWAVEQALPLPAKRQPELRQLLGG